MNLCFHPQSKVESGQPYLSVSIVVFSTMDPPDVGDNHPKFLEVGLENGIARLHSTLQHSPAVPILQPSLNGKIPHSNGSLSSISSYRYNYIFIHSYNPNGTFFCILSERSIEITFIDSHNIYQNNFL